MRGISLFLRHRFRALIRLLLPPVPLQPGELWLLVVLSGAMFVGVYDLTLNSLALKHVQISLGMHDADVGRYAALMRLGVLPAMLLALASDVYGRRRMLMISIVGVILSSLATSLVSTPEGFASAQFCARIFIAAEDFLTIVILVEVLRPALRGWGLGAFGAMGALGGGFAAALFAFIEVVPGGWRTLYVIGVIPMIGIAWYRRSIPETGRFVAQRAVRGAPNALDVWRPLVALFRDYPGRLLVMASIAGPFGFSFVPATFFMSKFMQDNLGLSPGEVSFMFIMTAGVPLMGNVVAGSFSDAYGRRRTMVAGILLAAIGAFLLYSTTIVWVAVAGWIIMLFAYLGVDILIGAMGAELFPTSYRSTASAARAIVVVVAAAAGFYCESLLFPIAGGHAGAILSLLLAAPIGGLVAWRFLVEAATRDLEVVSPERRTMMVPEAR